MIFSETKLKGAYIIDLERREDSRGFFARSWCEKEFEARRLSTRIAQINVGFSKERGTLRGLHYQVAPDQEVKVIRCTRGAIYDVIVDLRVHSPTYKQWVGVELNSDNHRTVYIPEEFAHGYLTLTDDTEIFYLTSRFYVAESARGVRYNDPSFAIQWPIRADVISEADQNWPDYLGQNRQTDLATGFLKEGLKQTEDWHQQQFAEGAT